MRKITLISLLVALIICLAFTVSCGKAKVDNDEIKQDSQSEENPYHELQHESPIDSEAPTSEQSSEEISEESTEPEPEPEPEKSLKFFSYGNGTCCVSGIGSIDDACIVIPTKSPEGDIVTSIDDLAFYGNENIKTVQIPSTVTSIGQRVFGGCSSLVFISVDTNNKTFRDIDGVLYTKDQTTLIHYPASSAASTLEISAKVKKISDMAFYGCEKLTAIYYGGSFEDWGKIDMGELNYGLYSASITCAGAGK